MVNRVLTYGLDAVACIIPALIGSSPANAVSRDQKMSNDKICRVLVTPHYHIGIGSGPPLEEGRAGRRSPLLEGLHGLGIRYGVGNVSRARHKSFSCAKLLNRRKCIFTAQPL